MSTTIRWKRPMQGRLWLEYRSECGRFLIERVPRAGRYRDTSRHDYRLTRDPGTSNERIRGFDTLREAKDEAELGLD